MLKSGGDDLIFVPPISKTGGDMSPPSPPRIDAPDCRANFASKVVTFPVHNINMYKIRKFRVAIFSLFYNICQPNFAILLILRCSFELW